MRTTTKVTSIVAACGAGAIGLALIGMGTGVGAQFTDSDTANANVAIGTFGCQLSSTDPAVVIHNNGHEADITFPTIQSSVPGTDDAPLTVTNSGSIPLAVDWTVTKTGHVFDSGHVTALPVQSGLAINGGNHRDYQIGFKWTELNNSDLGTKGTATYTAHCVEAQNASSSNPNLRLFKDSTGASATYDNGDVVLSLPSGDSAGYAGAQVVNPSATLPTSAPTFTTDNYAAGSPRFLISFSSGDNVFGYPGSAGSGVANKWSINNGPYVDYSQVLSQFGSATVTEVDVLMDGSQPLPATDTISCMNYNGSLIGSGTCS